MLIDGNNILRKAFYNVPIMTDTTGLQTNAIFGFVNVLLKVVEKEKPDNLCVVFGTEEGVIPKGLHEQFSVLKELILAMRINFVASEELKVTAFLGSIVGRLEKEASTKRGTRNHSGYR